jgi:hypothetical protein
LHQWSASLDKPVTSKPYIVAVDLEPCRYAKGFANDKCAVETREQDINGKDIGALAESSWLRVVPWSFYKLLTYVQKR